MCKAVVLLIKPIVFFYVFVAVRVVGDLKVPNVDLGRGRTGICPSKRVNTIVLTLRFTSTITKNAFE